MHFYTLLAEINDLSFQNEISKAIVEINELKSSLHHQALNDYEISQAIVKLFSHILRYLISVSILMSRKYIIIYLKICLITIHHTSRNIIKVK